MNHHTTHGEHCVCHSCAPQCACSVVRRCVYHQPNWLMRKQRTAAMASAVEAWRVAGQRGRV